MTEGERILTVFKGGTPDQVPYMLDLSHYFYQKFNKPWNLMKSYAEPERDLIDYHRKFKAGFYLPNLLAQNNTFYGDDVKALAWEENHNGLPEIHWRYETPRGSIERIRIWEPSSYSWAIKSYGVKTEDELRILGYALGSRSFEPLTENVRTWIDYVGDIGVVYTFIGYSAMGHILHYWMGIEAAQYACIDWNDTMHEVIDAANTASLELVKLLAKFPSPVTIGGDNFSTDLQPPSFFAEWSAPFYRKAAEILHEEGKKFAVHIDGRLRKSIEMIRDAGADIIDAVTPKPTGDISPAECRDEAGNKLILSGGVAPILWLPSTPVAQFEKGVLDWLELHKKSPALIANAGDQVPPGAEESRITLMRQLVDEHGKY